MLKWDSPRIEREQVTFRHELNVRMALYVKRGWTEIVATGGYSDAPAIFDHTAFSGATLARELRNALRRHARYVKAREREEFRLARFLRDA